MKKKKKDTNHSHSLHFCKDLVSCNRNWAPSIQVFILEIPAFLDILETGIYFCALYSVTACFLLLPSAQGGTGGPSAAWDQTKLPAYKAYA